MKRCQKCSRTYPDDNQKFCTVDGGRLESADSVESAPELGATVLTNQNELNAPPPDFNKTMASLPPSPTGTIRKGDTGPMSNRTVAASFQPSELPPPPPSPAPSPQPPPQTYQPEPPQYQQPPPQQQQPPQQPPPPQQYQQQPPAYQQQPPQQYQQPPQQQYQQPPQQPPPAQPSAPVPHAPAPQQQMGGHAPQHAGPPPSQAPARKGSKLPLVIGLVVVLLLAGGAAYYFLVLKKKEQAGANTNSNANVANANTNTNANANVSANTNGNVNTNTSANANTDAAPFEPPPDATQFVNTRANLSGKIADHFVPFSFYYPNSWELNTSIASEGTYFVRADRKLPPNYVQERFSVEWYESNGTYDADKANFSSLVTAASNNLAKLPGYEKLSEGQTKVNSMDAYEITFKGLSKDPEKGDIDYWGRVIFLPPGVEGQKNGLKLTLLTSSLAPELESIDDVGVKGELPVILDSLRLK